ncbi:proprotein convertase P-domain-containing protein, partial [Micromonospora rubida]
STGPLPAGVTVSFNPPSVTAGGSTTLTVSSTATAGSGSSAITVIGTSPSVARTSTLNLTVNGLPGCSGTNGTDVTIPDNTTVESAIVISGCAATPSTTSKVEVHIAHTYIGDLVVSLVAPDGSAYVLHNRSGSSTDNIDQTYTVNLSTETANGTWRLRVQDAASIDTGYLNSWTMTL